MKSLPFGLLALIAPISPVASHEAGRGLAIQVRAPGCAWRSIQYTFATTSVETVVQPYAGKPRYN